MHPGIKDIQVFLTHTNMNLPAPAPRGLAPPPLLAACRLLAINAHFTYSSTPLALICVALDILQQLNTAFLPSLEHRWPTRTQERGLGVPGL